MSSRGVVVVAGAAVVLGLANLACCCNVPVGGGAGGRWPWQAIQGSGRVVEEERQFSGFTGVSLRGVGKLLIEQGDNQGLRVEAEDNIIPYLETDLEGQMLVIGTKSGVRLRPTRPIIFRVTVREIDEIAVSGSGDAEGTGLRAGALSITVSGSGHVSLSGLEAVGLRVKISGSGNVEVSGKVERQTLTVSGSGEYRARDLASDGADVRISGSGSATIQVSDSLDAAISGSGSVRYAGNPTVQSTVTGSGSVRQISE